MAEFNRSQSNWAKTKLKLVLKGDIFTSARQWSIKSGCGDHAITDMIDKGVGSPKAIVNLARTGGFNVLEALVANGLINKDEMGEGMAKLPDHLIGCVKNLQSLSPHRQTEMIELIATAARFQKLENEQSLFQESNGSAK